VVLVEKTPSLLHVKTTLSRRKGPLLGTGPTVTDRLAIDLIQALVPISSEHPEGIAVAEWQIEELPAEPQATPSKEAAHVP